MDGSTTAATTNGERHELGECSPTAPGRELGNQVGSDDEEDLLVRGLQLLDRVDGETLAAPFDLETRRFEGSAELPSVPVSPSPQVNTLFADPSPSRLTPRRAHMNGDNA